MELIQVLHKSIPQRKKIFDHFQKKSSQDLSKFLLQLIKKVKKNNDMIIINQFFIELYDMLYHYIILDKIKIAKKVVRLLEELALPISYVGEEKRNETFKKIKKMKL